MMRGGLLSLVLVLAACGGSTSTPSSSASPSSSSSSSPGDPSTSSSGGSSSGAASSSGDPSTGACGAAIVYDIAKSKFAFGGTPVETTEPDGTKRYTGPNGVLVIRPFGHVSTSSNASFEGTDWSPDADALAKHVREYFVSLGAQECQIERTNVTSNSSGRRTIHLVRAIDGLRLVESTSYAQINANDQSDHEGIYWPAIPQAAIDAARAFRDRIATPDGLAEYKAKLPPDAQGSGTLQIHHTSAMQLPGEPKPFVAMATWDVMLDGAGTSALPTSFDENGTKIETRW